MARPPRPAEGDRSQGCGQWSADRSLRPAQLALHDSEMIIEAFGFVPLPARAFGATAPAGKGRLVAENGRRPAARSHGGRRAARLARRLAGPSADYGPKTEANHMKKPRLLAGRWLRSENELTSAARAALKTPHYRSQRGLSAAKAERRKTGPVCLQTRVRRPF